MKLIADSGSTKTDWSLVDESGKVVATCKSQGLNPYHLSEDEMLRVLQEEVKTPLLVQLSGASFCEERTDVGTIENLSVYFYGSGVTDAMVPKMETLLRQAFDASEAHAASDMLGAARALLGQDSGIAVILGTGSNSCLYDGKRIVKGVSPLGYILGDEGSGTAIGKAFFRLVFRHPQALSLREKFAEWSGMNYAAVIDRIYRQPLANTYLASVSTFVGGKLAQLKENSQENSVEFLLLSDMVKEVYRDFCEHILSYYVASSASTSSVSASSSSNKTVGFVGSIAYYFQDYIASALQENDFAMGKVLRSPMEGLLKYHLMR